MFPEQRLKLSSKLRHHEEEDHLRQKVIAGHGEVSGV
jgi:hypothetical protein